MILSTASLTRSPLPAHSWVPELASTYKGEPIIEETDFIDTRLELEGFARFIREGKIPEKMVLDPYYTSLWTLSWANRPLTAECR